MAMLRSKEEASQGNKSMGETHKMIKDGRGGLGNDLTWFIMHSTLEQNDGA